MWKEGFLGLKGQRRRPNSFFFSDGPKDAGQWEKKEEVGGVSGGRRRGLISKGKGKEGERTKVMWKPCLVEDWRRWVPRNGMGSKILKEDRWQPATRPVSRATWVAKENAEGRRGSLTSGDLCVEHATSEGGRNEWSERKKRIRSSKGGNTQWPDLGRACLGWDARSFKGWFGWALC